MERLLWEGPREYRDELECPERAGLAERSLDRGSPALTNGSPLHLDDRDRDEADTDPTDPWLSLSTISPSSGGL